MTRDEFEQWKATVRVLVEASAGILEMLEERRPHNYAHDVPFYAFQKAWHAYHAELLANMERDDMDYEVPELPDLLRAPA